MKKFNIIRKTCFIFILLSVAFIFGGCTEQPTNQPPKELESEEVVLRFAFVSDLHFSSVLDGQAKVFYQKALRGLQELTSHSLDAVVVPGDFSEGYREDYDTLINLTKEYAGEDVQLIASYGNHEGNGKHFQYEDAFKLKVDNVRTVKGFKFICIGAHANDTYLESQATWLDEKLTAITALDATKPVFTLMHHPLYNIHNPNDGIKTLLPTFMNHKQSFVLTAHDHLSFSDVSFWQGEFTSFRSSYLQNETEGQFALFTVTKDNMITIDKFSATLTDTSIRKIGTITIDYNEFLAK